MIRKFFKFIFYSGLILTIIGVIVGGVVGTYFYIRLTRDLPKIERISDYQPKAVTTVLSDDGVVMAEVWEERRFPVPFEEIPQLVKNAFLAAEDSNFYQHPGIDVTSIIRAIWVNFRHKTTRQGASTITQQIVKSLLLTREKTYERKIKEAILSYRLENALTKDEIFSIYLNEIFLGATAHGVKAAAKVHFQKELDELSVAEAAYLAGLPQKPSYLSNPANRAQAMRRQRYVIRQMHQNNMISTEERLAAEAEELVIHPPDLQQIYHAPYFVSHALRVLRDDLQKVNPLYTPTHPGGFTVQTTASIRVHDMAQRAVHRGLREVDKRRGWRGPLAEKEEDLDALITNGVIFGGSKLEAGEIYRAHVASIDRAKGIAVVRVGDFEGKVNLKKAAWAKKLIDKQDRVRWIDPVRLIEVNDVIEVSIDTEETKQTVIGDLSSEVSFQLDQTPELQGALLLANALTGEVKVIIGGYDYSQSQFNRATQALRQPGSAFKPVIYLAAIRHLNLTPATIVPDSPISLIAGNGELWEPKNYDRKFLGPMTLRTALQRSRNVVSVHLLQQVGIDRVIAMARRLGITTPIGRDMSVSLGTAEVYMNELVSAYGTFAAGGWLADQLVVKAVNGRDGDVLLKNHPRQRRVIDEDDAFLMANMMKGVIERGTAQVLKRLERPVAGKTGTTNEQMDAWFIGFTPEWVAGVWVGHDVKRSIGSRETGGVVAAPIFLYFMQEFLADVPPLDFDPPDGVIPVAIDLNTGRLVEPGQRGAFIEYFKTGTEPSYTEAGRSVREDYLLSTDF